MYIYKAAVVGAGAMGGGIAQVITYSGLPVILKDVQAEALQTGLDKVRSIYDGRVQKGKMSAGEMAQKLMLVSGGLDFDGFEDVDIVIEAVPEEMELKKQVLAELDRILPESAILASNTSALSISELASATNRPDRVVGMHFFNPAHVMKLVEVIPGLQTSEETVEDVITFAESLRKIPVRVEECAGFLVNRLLAPYLNEAMLCLQEGAAGAREIDEAMVAFGWPMGPFTLADMLGLDVCLKVAHILNDAYGPRLAVPPLLARLVAAGRTGQKSGAGIYRYEGEESGELERIVQECRDEAGVTGTAFSPERLNYALINEAVTCVQERVSSAGDVDIAMMAGTGFPMEMEGPLHHADAVGLDRVLERLEELRRELGERFWPAPMLKRMVAAGWTGRKVGKGFFDHLVEE